MARRESLRANSYAQHTPTLSHHLLQNREEIIDHDIVIQTHAGVDVTGAHQPHIQCWRTTSIQIDHVDPAIVIDHRFHYLGGGRRIGCISRDGQAIATCAAYILGQFDEHRLAPRRNDHLGTLACKPQGKQPPHAGGSPDDQNNFS